MCDRNDTDFWKNIGQVGISQERVSVIPQEVKDYDIVYSRVHEVLDKRKNLLSEFT